MRLLKIEVLEVLHVCRQQVPQVIQDFFGYYVLFNSLLGLLAGLQLLWMWGIGRYACSATAGGHELS